MDLIDESAAWGNVGTEMNSIKCVVGFTLKESKKSVELKILELIGFVIKLDSHR